jgi:predicted glycosyltransferase
MKFLIAVNHPAQYHLFKRTYTSLLTRGHTVFFVIKDKDILAELMNNEGVHYHKLLKKRIGNTKATILIKGFIDIINQGLVLLKFVKKYKPDVMFGTDYSITHVGKITGVPSIVFNEDDFNINKFFCRLSYPWASCIVSPTVCDVGKYSFKKINYDGYQKLAYLHPNIFTPDRAIVRKYADDNKSYFLIRLVNFSAGHDIEMKHGGISENVLEKLIAILEKHGNVFISSESKISDRFLNYRLQINKKDIHHLMAYASLIIADSQSMIVEASVLGTPSIRFNSFVGKISVLEELQNRYELTCGISNDRQDLLFDTINTILNTNELKSKHLSKRQEMLSDKIDVSAFISWFVENYPVSENIMRENPDYQYNFK